jgi:tetratricopeptide (TPR) repeat protein
MALAALVGGCVKTAEVKPEPAPPPIAEQPTEPACPEMSARELELQAITHLDAGDVEAGRAALACALRRKPSSKWALLLLEQLEADPVASLGPDYFWYTVKPSETLSKIAEHFLGSSLKFVILARYNALDVPANLVAGQRLKIPGTQREAAPSETTTAETDPVETAQAAAELRRQALASEAAGDLEAAYAQLQEAIAAAADLEGAADDLERIRAGLLNTLKERAYDQEVAGNVEDAVATWQRVLELDPADIPAQLALRRLQR